MTSEQLFVGVLERDDLPLVINRLHLTGCGIEIGTQYGRYAQTILGGTQLAKMFLLDCWDLVEDGDRFRNDSAFSKERLQQMEKLVRERFA